MSAAENEAAATELAEVELLDEATNSTIREPLLARAVVACSPPAEVEELRIACARALWDAGEGSRAGAQIAELYDLGEDVGDWQLNALGAAAAAASRGGVSGDAVSFLATALKAIRADDPRRLGLLIERARILSVGRDPGALEDLREAFGLAGDPVERGRIALAAGQSCFYLARFEDGAQWCRSAIAGLDSTDRELRLLLEAEAMNSDRLRGVGREHVRQLAPQAQAVSTAGERAVLAHVAAEAVASGAHTRDDVLDLALRAWHNGELLVDRGARAPVVSFLGTTLAWCEDFASTFELADAQLREGRSKRAPVTVSYALALRSGTRIRIGDLAGAAAAAEGVVGALPVSDPLAYMISFGWLLESQLGRGRIEEASSALAASGLTGELPDIGTVDFLLLSRGDVKLATGDVEAALDDYLEVGDRAERSGFLNPAGLAWRSRAARALVVTGDRERALALASDEVERARSFGAPRALGVGLRALAACTDGGARLATLEEAATTLARSEARLEYAGALIDLGTARIEDGKTESAQPQLEQGMDLAHHAGAHPLVARAMDGLRATGMRPRRPAQRGVDALTTQQLRVARLAARGRSNREIAEDLFLSRRTVELHLTVAYRKLEIDGREELAEALEEAGGDAAGKRSALPTVASGLLLLVAGMIERLDGRLELLAAAAAIT